MPPSTSSSCGGYENLPGSLTELGQRSIALVEVRGETPGQHLFHRRVVVVARHVPDLEAAVLALVGQAVLDDHHRADVVAALQVRHVVALDAQRRLGQRQQILQLGERAAARVVVAGPTKPMPHELFLGVARHRLVQVALVAAQRHADLHPRPAHHRQPFLVRATGPPARPERAPASARRAGGSSPYSSSRIRSISPPGLSVLDLVDDEALAADDPTLAHVEDLHCRFEVVVGEADHVDVFASLGDHLLLLDRPVHRSQPVADARRPLVLQRVRRPTSSPHRAA